MKRLKTLLVSLLMMASLPLGARLVGYVTSGPNRLPDPSLVTHINYAFADVSPTFDGLVIQNPAKLKRVVALKEKNPGLKVLLSVGGWGSGGFSEMARDKKLRRKFAKDCARVIEEYGLDGIDIDWEYPGRSTSGIASSPDDKENFNLLMKDIRKAIGKGKLLTMATMTTVGIYDYSKLIPLVDWFNIMAYDLGQPPHHNAPLFRSPMAGSMTADEGMRAHADAGIPRDKLVLGVPFYGRGDKKAFNDFVPDGSITAALRTRRGLTERYDSVAQTAWVADSLGKMVATYDTPQSLAAKAAYVRDNGYGGVMVWETGYDTASHRLLKALQPDTESK